MDNAMMLLEKLATVIGTTVEHLWPLYVRQAAIGGWIDLVIVIMGSLISLSILLFSCKKLNAMDKNKGDNQGDETLYIVGILLSGAFSFIFVTCGLAGAETIIGRIVNPEMYAVKAIIEDISRLTK